MPTSASDHAVRRRHRVPSRWTRPLQNLTLACSVVFVVGTTLQNFVIVDVETVRQMMELAGSSTAEAEAEAPGFVTAFRLVGSLYILANAVGLLARTGRSWVFWVVLAVNATQAAGVVMIPPEVAEVTLDRFGVVGLLPSLVTDGGAAVLSVILAVSLVRYRAPWASRRVPTEA